MRCRIFIFAKILSGTKIRHHETDTRKHSWGLIMNKMIKIILVIAVVFSVFLLSSCATKVGTKLSIRNCFCQKSIGKCSGNVGELFISYTISKIGEEYEVTGEATFPAGKTGTWTSFSSAFFTLYLVTDAVIVEEIPIAGGSGATDSTINFRRKFKAKDFDATTIGWSMKVRG